LFFDMSININFVLSLFFFFLNYIGFSHILYLYYIIFVKCTCKPTICHLTLTHIIVCEVCFKCLWWDLLYVQYFLSVYFSDNESLIDVVFWFLKFNCTYWFFSTPCGRNLGYIDKIWLM
jgi:hypothetical protein